MHAEYFAGIGKYDYSLTPLKDNKRTLGLTLLRFAVDDIPNNVFLYSLTDRLISAISPHFHRQTMPF
jgi:hypothetical protein